VEQKNEKNFLEKVKKNLKETFGESLKRKI
jgi:hypothetical protein